MSLDPTTNEFRPRRRNSIREILTQISVSLAFFALVAVPLGMYGCQSERANWVAARALNLYSQGNVEQAIQLLEAAVAQSDDATELSTILASTLANHGQAEKGLAICNRILAEQPNSLRALEAKYECEKELRRYSEALETMKSMFPLLDQSRAQSPTRLNNLAYSRALANQELEQALDDMNLVMRQYTRSNYWGFDFPLSLRTESVVAMVQLSRKLGVTELTLPILNREVLKRAQACFELEMELLGEIDDELTTGDNPSRRWEKSNVDPIRNELTQNRGEWSTLLCVQALVEQDTGHVKSSNRKRQLVSQLGFDANSIAGKLPPDPFYIETLRDAAAYLDTYGFLMFKLGDYENATDHLELALASVEIYLLALNSPLHNSSSESPRFEPELVEKLVKRTKLEILKHLVLVNTMTTTGAPLDDPEIRTKLERIDQLERELESGELPQSEGD